MKRPVVVFALLALGAVSAHAACPGFSLPTNYFAIMIRTSGDPTSLAAPVRRALHGVDPEQPVFDQMLTTGHERVRRAQVDGVAGDVW